MIRLNIDKYKNKKTSDVSSITKNEIQYIRSLQERKVREEQNCFVVEGIKMVNELIDRHSEWIERIYCTEPSELSKSQIAVQQISSANLSRISSLRNPNKALAIVRRPIVQSKENNSLVLVLDGIQDPGNMGTILRTADWFGVDQLICSLETVDCFNPKVVQSSMGSLFRVNVTYTALLPVLQQTPRKVYATTLSEQENHFFSMQSPAMIIIGNEGNGISNELLKQATGMVTIPRIGQAESLNAGVATGIVLAEFMRKSIIKN